MSDIKKAIEIVQFSRKTHVEWKKWMEANPKEAGELKSTLGDVEYQNKCIHEYDFVIDVLTQKMEHCAKV